MGRYPDQVFVKPTAADGRARENRTEPPKPTLGEDLGANIRLAWDDTPIVYDTRQSDGYDPLVTALTERNGKKKSDYRKKSVLNLGFGVVQYSSTGGFDWDGGFGHEQWDYDTLWDDVEKERKKDPSFMKGVTREQFDQKVLGRGEAGLRDLDTSSRGRWWTPIVGGLVVAPVDPVNYIPGVAGVRKGGSVGKAVLVGAAENLGIEALLTPDTMARQEHMGREMTMGDVGVNLTVAVLFGGTIGGGSQYGKNLYDRRSARRASRPADSAAPDATAPRTPAQEAMDIARPYLPEDLRKYDSFDDMTPEELLRASEVELPRSAIPEDWRDDMIAAEDDAYFDATNPFGNDGAGIAAHTDNLDVAVQNIMDGPVVPPRRPLNVPLPPQETPIGTAGGEAGGGLGASATPSAAGVGGQAGTLLPPSALVSGARKSSKFGPRKAPVKGASTDHGGIDLAAPIGTPIKASGDGVVVFSGKAGSAGDMVIIDHGGGVFSRYMHMSTRGVKVGDRVSQGGGIGAVGDTGRVSGPHLHYEVILDGKFDANGNRKAGTKVNPETFTGRTSGAAPAATPAQAASTSGGVVLTTPPKVRDKRVSVGEQNNNPGNMIVTGWTKKQPGFIGAGVGNVNGTPFGAFDTWENGVAAHEKLVARKWEQGGKTIDGITRYYIRADGKPDPEATAYAKALSSKMGLGVNEPIPVARLPELAGHMRVIETGNPKAASRTHPNGGTSSAGAVGDAGSAAPYVDPDAAARDQLAADMADTQRRADQLPDPRTTVGGDPLIPDPAPRDPVDLGGVDSPPPMPPVRVLDGLNEPQSALIPLLRQDIATKGLSLRPAAIAKRHNVSEADADIAINYMAARRMGVSLTAGRGAPPRIQRSPNNGPQDILKFITRNGGLTRDGLGDGERLGGSRGHGLGSAEIKGGKRVGGRDWTDVFIPGGGALIRKEGAGRSLDDMGEALWEAGYFGPPETTPRPTVDDVIQRIEDAINGERIYAGDVMPEDIADSVDFDLEMDEGLMQAVSQFEAHFGIELDKAEIATYREVVSYGDDYDVAMTKLAQARIDDVMVDLFYEEFPDRAPDIAQEFSDEFDARFTQDYGQNDLDFRRSAERGELDPGDAGEGWSGADIGEDGWWTRDEALAFERGDGTPMDPDALKAFDEPTGEGARLQVDSMEHDARAIWAAQEDIELSNVIAAQENYKEQFGDLWAKSPDELREMLDDVLLSEAVRFMRAFDLAGIKPSPALKDYIEGGNFKWDSAAARVEKEISNAGIPIEGEIDRIVNPRWDDPAANALMSDDIKELLRAWEQIDNDPVIALRDFMGAMRRLKPNDIADFMDGRADVTTQAEMIKANAAAQALRQSGIPAEEIPTRIIDEMVRFGTDLETAREFTQNIMERMAGGKKSTPPPSGPKPSSPSPVPLAIADNTYAPDMFGGPTSQDVRASLERQAQAPMRGATEQKAAGSDGGLFDNNARQADVEDGATPTPASWLDDPAVRADIENFGMMLDENGDAINPADLLSELDDEAAAIKNIRDCL